MNELEFVAKWIAWALVALPLILLPWRPHKEPAVAAIGLAGVVSGGVILIGFAGVSDPMPKILLVLWLGAPLAFMAGIVWGFIRYDREVSSVVPIVIGGVALLGDLFLKVFVVLKAQMGVV